MLVLSSIGPVLTAETAETVGTRLLIIGTFNQLSSTDNTIRQSSAA